MQDNVKFNKIICAEIGLIFVIWLISIWISNPVFNRPLYAHHEWLTAHALVSLRAFEDWGFWKLLGTSILVPHSNEFLGVDLTSFTRLDGIYLSYPSFYLILPYLTFKFLNLFSLNIDLSTQYLETYNLIVHRLITSIVIYYLYIEIIKVFAEKLFGDYVRKLIAFLCVTTWLFAPPVMYFTQNVYGPDQAVLLPLYIIFLISIKCKFKFQNLSIPYKLLLFIASLCACGMDWYAFIFIGILMGIVFIDELISYSKESNFSLITLLKHYFNSIKYCLSGMFIAGLTFLLQLLYFRGALSQLYATFLVRIGNTLIYDNAQTTPITNSELLTGIFKLFIHYLPIPSPFFDTLNKTINQNNQIILPWVILFITIIIVVFYFFYQNTQDRSLSIYVYVLLFLAPLLQIWILKEHSYMHKFSAFKMALPIDFILIVLPALLLSLIIRKIFTHIKFNVEQPNVYLSIFVIIMCLLVIQNNKYRDIEFAEKGSNLYQEMGVLVTNNIDKNDLPIASNSLLLTQFYPFPSPPNQLFYTDRFIYPPKQLKLLLSQNKINVNNLKKMSPIFLAVKNENIEPEVDLLCQDKWVELAEKIDDHEIIACRNIELSYLLNLDL